MLKSLVFLLDSKSRLPLARPNSKESQTTPYKYPLVEKTLTGEKAKNKQ